MLSSSIKRRASTLIILFFVSNEINAHYVRRKAQSPKEEDFFDYNRFSRYGPQFWGKNVDTTNSEYYKYLDFKRNECSGDRQSPVNLVPSGVCVDDHQARTRRGRPHFETIDFKILPYALRANFKVPDDHKQSPRVDFSNLSYWVPAIHAEVKIPAEHRFNGTQYKAEFQIVHYWEAGHGRFVIISILMDNSSNEHNVQLEEFIRGWEVVAWRRKHNCDRKANPNLPARQYYYPQRKKLEMAEIWGSPKGVPGQANWDLYKFITTPWYCGYKGSLTIPPCSERAYWRILDLPMKMSTSQYVRMRKLLLEQLDDNCQRGTVAYQGRVNRPLQQNSNEIFCCTRNNYKGKNHWKNHTFPEDYDSWRKTP